MNAGHDDEKRKVIHATVCAPAADELRAFCIGHGVTVTAFLDGLGHVVADLQHASMEELITTAPSLAAALVLARSIDAARRSRETRQPPFSSSSAGAKAGVPPAG